MTTPLATWVGDPSYLSGMSYLTPREYRSSPIALDPAELLPAGTADQQAAALATLIARASAEADRICRQPLGATRNVEDARLRVNRDGMVIFPARHRPILTLDAAAIGSTPATATAVVDGSRVRIGDTTIEIPAAGAAYFVPGGPLPGLSSGGKVYVRADYVSGFPHGFLTANAGAGGTTLTVDNPLGIIAGARLGIYDDLKSETVVAAAPAAGNVVTLAAPLAYAHTASEGVGVSALPADAKAAVAELVNASMTAALNAGGAASEKIGNYAIVYADPDASRQAARGAELLSLYRRTGM